MRARILLERMDGGLLLLVRSLLGSDGVWSRRPFLSLLSVQGVSPAHGSGLRDGRWGAIYILYDHTHTHTYIYIYILLDM